MSIFRDHNAVVSSSISVQLLQSPVAAACDTAQSQQHFNSLCFNAFLLHEIAQSLDTRICVDWTAALLDYRAHLPVQLSRVAAESKLGRGKHTLNRRDSGGNTIYFCNYADNLCVRVRLRLIVPGSAAHNLPPQSMQRMVSTATAVIVAQLCSQQLLSTGLPQVHLFLEWALLPGRV